MGEGDPRATDQSPELSDEIETLAHTPGARLSNARSDEIHRSYVGDGTAEVRPAHAAEYERLVLDELAYKQDVLTAVIDVLVTFPESNFGGSLPQGRTPGSGDLVPPADLPCLGPRPVRPHQPSVASQAGGRG